MHGWYQVHALLRSTSGALVKKKRKKQKQKEKNRNKTKQRKKQYRYLAVSTCARSSVVSATATTARRKNVCIHERRKNVCEHDLPERALGVDHCDQHEQSCAVL
jgi:hypothetical protein